MLHLSFQVVQDDFEVHTKLAKVRQDQIKHLNGVFTSLRSKIKVMGMDPVKLKEERDSLELENIKLRSRLEQKQAELQAIKNERAQHVSAAHDTDDDKGGPDDPDDHFVNSDEDVDVQNQDTVEVEQQDSVEVELQQKDVVFINLDDWNQPFSIEPKQNGNVQQTFVPHQQLVNAPSQHQTFAPDLQLQQPFHDPIQQQPFPTQVQPSHQFQSQVQHHQSAAFQQFLRFEQFQKMMYGQRSQPTAQPTAQATAQPTAQATAQAPSSSPMAV